MEKLLTASTNRGKDGRFVQAANPPSRPVQVYLPDPLISALDAYGKKNGTGRGKSIQTLLKGILDAPEEAPAVDRADKSKVRLALVKRSDPIYTQYRKDHYIPDRGVVGQQLQYLM